MNRAKRRAKWEESCAAILHNAGWWRSDDGWRHRNLNGGVFPWPDTMAMQLQDEAWDGRQEIVHRMLRGDDV